MIKFMANTESGIHLLGLGLSAMNLTKLKGGKPIDMDLRSMGIKLKICIFYGETEEKMAADLQDLIGPDTEIRA